MNIVIPIDPEHPVFKLPNQSEFYDYVEKYGIEAWNAFVEARNKRIRMEKLHPFECGVELPSWYLADFILGRIDWETFCSSAKCPDNLKVPDDWKTDKLRNAFENNPARMLLILGGTGSAKTEYMLKRLVADMRNNKEHTSWAFHETRELSIDYHQKIVYKYIPKDWEDAGKGKVAYVSYKVKTGFSEMSLVSPMASKMTFRSYEQDIKSIESGKLGSPDGHASIGYITDELCPLSYLETLRGRIAARNACGIHGFTPLQGYSPIVKWFRDNAECVLSRVEKDISRPREIPLVEQKIYADGRSKPMKVATVYFHSKFSPYSNYEGLKQLYASDSDSVKLIRYDGFCEQEKQNIFPKLNRKIHGFYPNKTHIEGTNYMYVDPCGIHRNWFMLWVRVDAYGRKWVYREWPCRNIPIPGFGCPGPWAEDGQDAKHRVGGVPGLGSKSFGFGIRDYKNEIARLEGWNDLTLDIPIMDCDSGNGSKENIYWRKIDSRFSNVGTYAAEHNTTLLEECAKAKLYFDQTSGKKISEGIQLINNALSYKENWESPEFGPKLFISLECENLWFALENYTGEGGEKEATKDPIDVLRYAMVDDPPYIGDTTESANLENKTRLFDKNAFYEIDNGETRL